MKPFKLPSTSICIFFLFSLVLLPATASTLQWNPTATTPPVGGSGTWSTAASNWWDGTVNVTWPAGEPGAAVSAEFGAPAGVVSISGAVSANSVGFLDGDYQLSISYGGAALLNVYGGLSGEAEVLFPSSGQVARYSDAALQRGLHFRGGGPVTVAADLRGAGLHGAPVIGVWGSGTVVTLTGKLSVADDGGQTFVSIAPREGGHLIFGDEAEVDVILGGSLFTRQLWVHGDGTGTIEFAPGFVADLTEGGTVARGLGSYRISNTRLITHHTQGLPTSERPDGSGGTQINGHLVFENSAGSIWQVKTNPQTYNAGVWIQQDMTIETEVDLTHTGVTTFSSHSGNYWAANAFQTDADNVTVTKTGHAALILAAEAAFRPGSILRIEAGTVRFLTDPAAGVQKNIAPNLAGPNLQLQIRYGGRAELLAAVSEVQSVDNFEGELLIGGDVGVLGDFTQNHQEFIGSNPPPNRKLEPEAGYLIFRLGAQDKVALSVDGIATLGGFLQIEREPGFSPAPGTVFDILFFEERVGTFAALNDFSDLGVLVEYLADRIRLTTTRNAGRTGVVVDEDFTTGQFNNPDWQLLNNPSQVGFFAPNNRPEIAQALVHRVNHGTFTWGVAFLDTPTFRIGPDEVLVQKMTTFSDVANSNSQYFKVEIAALHADTHAPFGHNRSAELSRNYSTNAGDQMQLFPSLYNDDVTRLNFAHHSGASTSSTLQATETSMVVFRPDGDGSTTRLEVFGENQSNGNMLIPFPLEHWNTLQISMPRQWRSSGSILASGVAQADAQMGMSSLHVGITHRTDANLDYVTDAADFIIWNSYRGQSGTHLQTGDFTNSRSTGEADLSLLLGAIGTIHDEGGFNQVLRYHTIDLPGTGSAPEFIYYQSSGRMLIRTNGTAVSAWQISGPAPLQRADLANNADWWRAHVAGKEQAVDAALAGVAAEQDLGTYVALLEASDFGTVHYGFAGGGGGFTTVTIAQTDPDQPGPEPQLTVLLDDSFADLSQWQDLSTAISWAGAPESGSVFQITSGALNLNDASRTATMWGASGMRSFSAIDFAFPGPVLRRTNEITVEWRMRWQSLGATGENSRVAFMLLHDYPSEGVDLTRDAKVGDFSEPWFGRPAYQVRVRGGFNPPDAASYLMYGGGHDPDGEFEVQSVNGTPAFWLPGFVSGAGGVTPGTSPTFNYPLNSWSMGTTAPASTTYKRYRYIVSANAQQLWVNHNDDGETWVLDLEMPLPFEENAPVDPAPPLYRYFEQIEAMRIYFRSPGAGASAPNVFLDSVKVSVFGDYRIDADPDALPPHYVAWGQSWFGGAYGDPASRDSLWGPDANPANDGISNRLKAGMGLSPFDGVPDGLLQLVDDGSVGLRFRFSVNADLNTGQWALLQSDTLYGGEWGQVPIEQLEILYSDSDYKLYQFTVPEVNPGSAAFIRLALP